MKGSKKKRSTAQPAETRLPENRLPTAWLLLATFAISGLLLFFNLGHYSLWDDEAMDALSARGILASGDTSAVLGSNVVAYRDGLLLVNLRHQGMPPFTAYAVAASMKLFGETPFAARLPLAACGWACVAAMLFWIWKQRCSLPSAVLFCLAILGSTPLFLYSRQCHYYGAAMFFYVSITYLYLYAGGDRRKLALMGFLSALLMAANYTFFVILYGCLALDFLLWRRKEYKWTIPQLVILFAPQLLMGLVLLAWWNPLQTGLGKYLGESTFADRLRLLLWNWRDLNRTEMAHLPLLLLAVPVAVYMRDRWLKRMLLALLFFVLGMTALSTQIVSNTSVADVRYLSAIVPLCIGIEVLTLRTLILKFRYPLALSILTGLLVFGTNVSNDGPLLWSDTRSTIAAFVGELLNPPPDPYTAASKWVNENVREGESIWVVPDYMTYPLMFHAPKAVYAWQLEPDNKDPQFAGLPPIHFKGRVPPDYILAFGPVVQQIRQILPNWQGVSYEEAARIDCFWKDLYRPELFWRSFTPIKNYNPALEAIYVFKRRK